MKTLTFASVLGISAIFSNAAPVLETVANFERPPGAPIAPLVLAGDGNFYGTTSGGGWNDKGTIFRMTPAGALSVVVHFSGTNGAVPLTGLVVGADGSLYGTASEGGTNGLGTIFKMTTTGTLTTLVNFSGISAPAKGGVPSGELHLAADGNFYGTTLAGGVNDLGTVFKITPAGTLTTLREFTGPSGSSKGAEPRGRLAADLAGTTLFGVCARGGADDLGSVFKITTAGSFTSLKEFTGASGNTKGESPTGGLIRATDGAYYGVTESGGADDLGTIFKITSGGNLTTLADGSTANGGAFSGALYQAADGFLYGTAGVGGLEDLGVVFKITTGGAFSIIHDFLSAEGSTPRAALIPGPDGALYSPTSTGGSGQRGTVFKVTTAGVFTQLASFENPSGWSPSGGLTPSADGSLIVPFTDGGANGWGAISRLTTAGIASTVVSFSGIDGATRGSEPVGALVAAASGDYYGMTRHGGASDGGTAFRLSATDAFTSISGFGSATGQFPEDGLIAGPDGFFYGAASEGGANGVGSVFRMTSLGTRTRIVSFTGVAGDTPGARPNGALTVGNDGSLYGTTAEGGANDKGTLYKIDAAAVFSSLVAFDGANGSVPLAALARSVDGNLYGTTSTGGASNVGTVFRVTPAGVLTTVVHFSGATGTARGALPAGALLCAPDGTLYGTTSAGGANGFGTIFRVSPSGVISTLFDFTNANGAGGPGAPVVGADGSIYGVSPDGGPQGGGVLYRLRQFGPHIGTDAPASLTTTSAELPATLVNGGEITSVSFEYGTTAALGSETAVQSTMASHPSFVLGGLTVGETIFYRAKASNASGTSLGAIRSFTVPAAFAAWKIASLGDGSADDLLDVDGDGLTLLHEYALALSPTAPDAAPAPELRNYIEGQRLSMLVTRDPARDDVTIEVQSSSEIAGPWTTIASSVNGAPFSGSGYFAGEVAGSAVRTVEIRDTVNITDAPQRFIRLRLQH